MTASVVFGGLTLTDNVSYRMLQQGADLGSPVPVVTSIRSLFLDGSIVSGRFSDNREMGFNVVVMGANAIATAVALDALAFQVNQQVNALAWTPETGLPIVFDTFRGRLRENFSWGGRSATQRLVMVENLPALPFGRTPTPSTLATSAISTVVLDGFEASPEPNYTATGVASTPLTRQTSLGGVTPYAGTYFASGSVNLGGSGYGTPYFWQISSTFASTSLTGRTTARVAVFDGQLGPITRAWKLTLSSAGGSSTWASNGSAPAGLWTLVSFDLSATPVSTTGAGYSAGAVTGYTLREDGTSNQNYATTAAFMVDQLAAVAPVAAAASSIEGAAYLLGPVTGSARAPVAVRVDRGGANAVKDLLLFKAPPEAAASYAPMLTGSSPYSTPTGVPYEGTFTLVASIKAGSQGVTQPVAVSIQQKQGAASVGTAWTSGTVNTAAGDAYAMLGEVTLPLVATGPDNGAQSFTLTVTTGAGAVLDLFLLDTRGAMVLLGPAPLTAAVKYLFVAAPETATGVGGVFSGSAADGSDAVSVLASCRPSGGQLSLDPGSNMLLVVSTQASSDLAVTATYSPRWLTERTS